MMYLLEQSGGQYEDKWNNILFASRNKAILEAKKEELSKIFNENYQKGEDIFDSWTESKNLTEEEDTLLQHYWDGKVFYQILEVEEI